MLQTGRPDEYRVTVLALHQAVMRDPAESDLGHRQIALLRNLFNGRERTEVRVVPVTSTIVLVEEETSCSWVNER